MEFLKKKITHKKFSYGKNLASFIILKIVKGLMKSGKYQKFFNILIRGLKNAVLKLRVRNNIKITPISLLLKIIMDLGPFCDVRALKASGRRVLVPAPFRIQKRVTVAVRFLIQGFFLRHTKFGLKLHRAITDELLLLYSQQNSSEAFILKEKFISNIFYNEKHLRFLRNI
jgi:ribosomal protein S7